MTEPDIWAALREAMAQIDALPKIVANRDVAEKLRAMGIDRIVEDDIVPDGQVYLIQMPKVDEPDTLNLTLDNSDGRFYPDEPRRVDPPTDSRA